MYHVLITDDDALMRNVLKKIVSKNTNFKVVAEASNGEDAIRICQESYIDLVLLDIVMPQMNGLEAAREIHSLYPHITICFISSYSETDYIKQIMDFHTDRFFQKPLSVDMFMVFLNNFHKNRNQKQSPELLSDLSLNDCSFTDAITRCNEYIDNLYGDSSYADNLSYDRLSSIANNVYRQSLFLTKDVDVLSLFPLQKDWIRHKELIKLWFFQILNNIWQKRSIRRYDILEIVFSYIDMNIKENISLSDIVNNCMLSQGYLSRIFRDQLSISVMDYIRIRKIHMIKINLIFTSRSITDIAEYIGYTDARYMGKVFKKETNMSLNDYRKSIILKD